MISTKKYLYTLLPLTVIMLLTLKPVVAQQGPQKSIDTIKIAATDTLLPNIVIKVALYTSTIDHTDFLIRRKLDITPISLGLPEIESKVKNFKNRLEKYI